MHPRNSNSQNLHKITMLRRALTLRLLHKINNMFPYQARINQTVRELVVLRIAKPANLELFKPILLGRIFQDNHNTRKRRRLLLGINRLSNIILTNSTA
jgi:hypothetical protein